MCLLHSRLTPCNYIGLTSAQNYSSLNRDLSEAIRAASFPKRIINQPASQAVLIKPFDAVIPPPLLRYSDNNYDVRRRETVSRLLN